MNFQLAVELFRHYTRVAVKSLLLIKNFYFSLFGLVVEVLTNSS